MFQRRFKGELSEGERYLWNVSRCVNLNPVRGKRPLVERPESAYRRYVDAGMVKPPANPLADVVEGWLLGGREFVERINRQLRSPNYGDFCHKTQQGVKPRSWRLGSRDVFLSLRCGSWQNRSDLGIRTAQAG